MSAFVERYGSAIYWNLISTAFSGVCGFLVLLIIGGVYGPQTLGVFNQVYAFYIVFSQFGAFGVHLSLLKHLAEHDQDSFLRKIIFSSGMLLSVVIAFFWASFLWFGRDYVGMLFSRDVGRGVGIVSVGVFFFSLNKAMMSSANGMSLLKEYAFFQALRFCLMFFALVLLMLFGIEGGSIPLLFPFSEGVLFLWLLFFFRRCFVCSNRIFSWSRCHFLFGLKALGGHVLVLMNTRIDVLCLGLFTDDKTVGIYSLAAIFVETACQLPTVFRTVFTPDIVKIIAERRQAALLSLVRRSSVFLRSTMLIIAVAGYFCIDLVFPALTGKVEYRQAASLFLLLMSGVFFASTYMPFMFLLVSGGTPGFQSFMVFLVISVNIAGNLMLIPFMGASGAAIATSFANIGSVFFLKYFVKRCLGFII